MHFESKEFRELQRHWYQVIKDKGFKDIETFAANSSKPFDMMYRPGSCTAFRARNRESIEDYYYYGTHFFNEYEFENEFDKNVWGMHMEGIPYRTIAKTLNTNVSKTFGCIKKLAPIYYTWRAETTASQESESELHVLLLG